jgi:hypothetical protein
MRCGKKMIEIPESFSQKDCDGGNAAQAEGINHPSTPLRAGSGQEGSQRKTEGIPL